MKNAIELIKAQARKEGAKAERELLLRKLINEVYGNQSSTDRKILMDWVKKMKK
mgnify:CR=1 FL=1